MLRWPRLERSQSLENERHYVRGHVQASAPRARKHDTVGHSGLVVCLSDRRRADCRQDDSSRHDHLCTDSLAKQLHVSSTHYDSVLGKARNTSSPSVRQSRQRGTDQTRPRHGVQRCRDSAANMDDEYLRRRQSRLMVNYEERSQQLSTHTQTETLLRSSAVRPSCSSAWFSTSADSRLHRHQRQSRSSEKKRRLSLSCVMVDFSGLLRRLRHLRVSEHETLV